MRVSKMDKGLVMPGIGFYKMEKGLVMPGTGLKIEQALSHARCGFQKCTRVWSCQVRVLKMDKGLGMPDACFKNGQGFGHAGYSFQ